VPFKKITVNVLPTNLPDGTDPQKIELLCDGQQLAVDGIHPDTHQPYRWPLGAIGDVRREDLPAITVDEAERLVADIVKLLISEHGYRLVNAKGVPETFVTTIGNGHDNGPTDWPGLVDLVDHETLTAFAMKLLKSGMHAGAAKNMLCSLVAGLVGVDPERKQRSLTRYPTSFRARKRRLAQAVTTAKTSANGTQATIRVSSSRVNGCLAISSAGALCRH
jgi:hypothetical protein